MLPAPFLGDQGHEQRGEVAEADGLFMELIEDGLEAAQRELGGLERFGQAGADVIAALAGQAGADAARHRPGRMNFLATQELDDLLAELPQANAPTREVGVGGDQAEDVPRGRIAIHAQDQVGPAQVEERQRVGLDNLTQVHEPAELVRGRRNA